jgi:hypothetical protein
MFKKIVQSVLRKTGYQLTKLAPSIFENESKQKDEIIAKGKNIIKLISPELVVLNGPFKGLVYPSINITESTLVPKIVGSYEAQLHPVIEKISKTTYSDILDIGSAEGYYAIGLAKKMTNATVHCFDINENDIRFCKEMADKNNVSNLTYNNWCDPHTLMNFDFKGRSLIFCDCEGYEIELFTPEVINSLQNVDVLIELHDIANPIISAEILSRFQHSHSFEIVNNKNVDFSHLTGLDRLTKEDREFATFEHRGGFYQNIFMEWAFLTAKEQDVN